MKQYAQVTSQGSMPYIGLQGDWISKAGFLAGTQLQIDVDREKLTISPVPGLETIVEEDRWDYRGYTVRLVIDRDTTHKPIKLESTEDTYRFLKPLHSESREVALSIALDPDRQVVNVYEVAKGSPLGTNMNAYEVLKSALLSNSTEIILAHNHPNARAKPSLEDLSATGKLIEAAKYLHVSILDHIIIGFDDYASLREMGFIDKWY